MPIHVRANPGDYADACLLPGDPLRAKYIAETFLDDAVLRNEERAMFGFTGEFEGKPISVQATGMGCPSAAIVFEELTCSASSGWSASAPAAASARPRLGDPRPRIGRRRPTRPPSTYMAEPHVPTADCELVHAAVHSAKELGQPVRVGPIVSSDLFYNPDDGQYQRWSDRGILAVEMEAAVLFTLGALRKVKAGCLLTVSDVVVEGEFVRITDEEMRNAVDQMTQLALRTAIGTH